MSVVGLIINPHAAQDVRRLVGLGRVVDVEEKANLAARFLAGLGSDGPTVLALDDAAGVARRAVRLAGRLAPTVELLDGEPSGTAADTRAAAATLRRRQAAWVATIGGDGTVRAVVDTWPDVRLVPIAAGTNNAIALGEEPTVLGRAALAALEGAGFRRVPRIEVHHDGATTTAVVDVVGVATPWTGTGALWEPGELVEALVVNASPTAVGIAAVAAAFGPPAPGWGVHLVFGGGHAVRAPFAPGLVLDVPVREALPVGPGSSVHLRAPSRVLALDGERLVVADEATARVADGPWILDAAKALGTRKVPLPVPAPPAPGA